MAEIMQGLFGVSPESLNAQRAAALDAQALKYASLDPFQQANYGIYKGASQLGTGVAGLMGAQDPEMQRVTQRQQMLRSINPSDPDSLKQGIQGAMQSGDYQMASELNTRYQSLTKAAQEARKTEAEIGAKLSEKSTPEMKNAAALAGTEAAPGTPEWTTAFNKELARLNTKDGARDQIKEVGVAVGSNKPVYTVQTAKGIQQIVFETNAKGEQAMVPYVGAVDRTTAKVSASAVNHGENKYAETFLGGVATQDLALKTAAEGAPAALENIASTRNILKNNNVFTGAGADLKLNVLAFGQALGVTGATADNLIANTQQLQQQRSTAVIAKIKGSGLGSGQGFTDKDLTFLQNASAGRITLSPETIKRQLDIEEKVEKALTLKWNNRVSKINPAIAQSAGLSPVQLGRTEQPSSSSQNIPGQSSQSVTQAPVYATNPTTKQRIVSTDGGATWTQAR